VPWRTFRELHVEASKQGTMDCSAESQFNCRNTIIHPNAVDAQITGPRKVGEELHNRQIRQSRAEKTSGAQPAQFHGYRKPGHFLALIRLGDFRKPYFAKFS
jgi:hypothetical protein